VGAEALAHRGADDQNHRDAHRDAHKGSPEDGAGEQMQGGIGRIEEENRKGTGGEHKDRKFDGFEYLERPMALYSGEGGRFWRVRFVFGVGRAQVTSVIDSSYQFFDGVKSATLYRTVRDVRPKCVSIERSCGSKTRNLGEKFRREKTRSHS